MHNEKHELVNLAAFDISFYVPFMYLEFYYASLPSVIPDHATLLLRPPLSLAVYGLPMRWGGQEGKKLSAHSLRVPPAPTTIICLLGPNPPSQIFTGCWFHSVTVTIWTLHGGLISRTRPIRKLSESCAGQSCKPAPEVLPHSQALLMCNDVFI